MSPEFGWDLIGIGKIEQSIGGNDRTKVVEKGSRFGIRLVRMRLRRNLGELMLTMLLIQPLKEWLVRK